MNYGAPFRPNDETPSQKVSYSGASARTLTAFGSQTHQVRIVASTDCYIRLGDGTVAASASRDMFVKANWSPEIIVVAPGQYIAVVQDAAAGTLFVTEVTR